MSAPNKPVESQHVVHHINPVQQQVPIQQPAVGGDVQEIEQISLLTKIKNVLPSTKWIIIIIVSIFSLFLFKRFFSKEPVVKEEKTEIPRLKKDFDYYTRVNKLKAKPKPAVIQEEPESDESESDAEVEVCEKLPEPEKKIESGSKNSRLIKEFSQDIIVEEDEEEDFEE